MCVARFSDLSGTADVFALGFGLFNITGSLIYSLSESYALEIIFDLILILGSFAIGYSIGAAKRSSNKSARFDIILIEY